MKKIIAIACMAWIALAGAWADNISAEDITLPVGGTKTVNISLTNTESNLVSFQIDLTLPEGISINKAGCSLSNRISDPDQELAIGKQGNNVYRIASTSFALTPISGTSGTLLTLSLTASANSEGGTATLSNIRFFTSNSERVTISDASFNIITAKQVVVGNGSFNQELSPVCNWWIESYYQGSQIIYLASEINSIPVGSSIKSISFTCSGGNAYGGSFHLRIGETDDDDFQSTSDMKLNYSDEIYGNITLESYSNGDQIIFPLSKKYKYKGGNLVIDIRSTEKVNGSGWVYFKSTETDNARTRVWYMGSSESDENRDDNVDIHNFFPNAIIEFEDICYDEDENITFADANVKAICVQNWDTNGDGELSEAEAAAVTDLGEVFKENSTITSFDELKYFTGLTEIADGAFNECYKLKSVILPSEVTRIGNSAFWGCEALTEITIPNCVISIEDNAFTNCLGLASVTIPNSVTNIGISAFSCCHGLTEVTIPNSVASIGWSAFTYCISLTSIKVENGNTKYDSRNNCNAIIETASNTLITGCMNTVIPNSVTSIGSSAFSGCTGLTSITIPNSVTSIEGYAFSGCSGLTSITIPNSVTSIEQGAFQHSGLTSITIPNSVTSIGYGAFRDCSFLTSVTIPNSVTSIGNYAFNNYNCSGLASVTVEMVTPPTIAENTFSNRANATLYVPAGCKAAYEAADYWKEFKQIIETAELYAVPENFTPADNQEIQATASVKLVYGNGGGWSQSYYDPIFEEFPYRVRGSENPSGGYTPGLVGTLPYTGTFYSFTPSQDGYIEIAVSFASGKSFYIAGLSDAYNYSGDAVLTDINGNVVTLNSDYQVSEQFTGTVKLGIKKGETYLMFCNSTKYCCLYGFRFTPGVVIEDTGTPHEPQAWDFTSYLSEADKANIAADGNWTISPVYDTNEYGNTTNEIRTYCYEYTQAFYETPVTANGVELGLTQGLKFKTKIDYNKNYFKYYDGERLHHAGSKNGPIIPDCGKGDVVKIRYKINEGGRGFKVNYTELTEGTLIGETEGIYEATLTVKRKVDVIFSSVGGTDILALAVNTDLPKLKNPVTITADSYTIEYGDELPEFTFTTEGSELEGTPVIICDATASSPAGTYDITIDASNVANSQVTIVNGTLTINKAKLTASVGEYTIQEGDDIPEFDISYSGFKNNEDKSVLTTEPVTTCEATSASPAGTYAITLAGGEAANYDISYVAGTLTVEENTAPTDVSQIDNVVYPLEKEASAGGQAVLSFNLKNTDLIRGFEFDLYLPDGVTAVESDGDIEASLTPERMPGNNSHSLSVSEQPDGSLHFLCSAFDNKNYATGDSEVMTLRIKLSKDMPLKEYAIVMRNVLLGKTNINQYYETEKVISRLIVDEYMLGDVNGDGNVNLTDYIWTANYIHKNASEEYILQAGDINGDGNINLLDYIGIANIIHYGSPSGEATAGAKADVFEEPDEGGAPDPQ